MRRNWNPYALLVRIRNGATTVGKFGISSKIKHNFYLWPCNSTPNYTHELKTLGHMKTYTRILVAALFIIAINQ